MKTGARWSLRAAAPFAPTPRNLGDAPVPSHSRTAQHVSWLALLKSLGWGTKSEVPKPQGPGLHLSVYTSVHWQSLGLIFVSVWLLLMHSLWQFLPRLDVPLGHVYTKISVVRKYDGWPSNQRHFCRDNPHKTVHRLLPWVKSMKTVHRSSSNWTCKNTNLGSRTDSRVNLLLQPLGCM